MKTVKPFIFNPDEEPRDMLIATFVIRQVLFEKIYKGIKESSRSTPPQHFLMVGQRGMGKTTLLLRIKYAVEDDVALADYILVVRFPEEQYNIGCLPDFWEETAIYLEGVDGFENLLDEFKPHEKKPDYERICFELLEKRLKQNKKRILYLIDNFGDLLKKFTDTENHRLREILMTSPSLQLLGASSEMLEHNFSYDKPFFEFFYQLKLAPLTKNESIDLLQALARNYGVEKRIADIISRTPERIEALRRITGGVPRTLVLLFEIFIDYNDGSAFEDLEHLADKVLPLYKARMDSLKPQQQKILDAMARAWEAISASEILEQSKLYRENITSNQISSQLKQMEENQLIESIETGKRTKKYRIRERFFNIWYLMRNGRKQNKEQVLWLIRFLETWCTVKELQEFADNHIQKLADRQYSSKAAYYKTMALNEISSVNDESKEKLLRHTESFLIDCNRKDWADTIHKLLDEKSIDGLFEKAKKSYELGNEAEGENILLNAVKENRKGSLWQLGFFYETIAKKIDKAEKSYLRAAGKGDVAAFNNLGAMHHELKNIDKAEKYYLMAIENGDIAALNNLALLYRNDKDDFEKAKEYVSMAIDKGDIKAYNNLAILYQDNGRDLNKAEEYYFKAIEVGHVDALNNLGKLYKDDRNDFVKAEKYFLEAIKQNSVPALYNLAQLYHRDLKSIRKAEKYYLEAIDKGDTDSLTGLAILYRNDSKKIKRAEKYFLDAIGHTKDCDGLRNLALHYQYDLKDLKKAEKYYLEAIANGDIESLSDLGSLYWNDFNDSVNAEKYFLKAINQKYFPSALWLFDMYWSNNLHIKGLELCKQILQNEDIFIEDLDTATQLIIRILAKEQYQLPLDIFKQEDNLLSKYMQPMYYVLAWFAKDELPGEYEKAGSEIKETVDEIVARVEEIKRKDNEIKTEI